MSKGRREKVTRVIDGDTIKTKGRKNPIRLAGVNAPEKGTSGASRATDKLKKLVSNEEVRVVTVARDKYGRSVANIYKGRESVNKKMKGFLKK